MKLISKSKIKSVFWAVSSMAIGASFVLFIFQAVSYKTMPKSNLLVASSAESPREVLKTEAPKYYFSKDAKSLPKISAEAYVVGDLSTGKIILAKNQNKKFPIASVSKLITSLVSQDLENNEDLITITKTALATEGRNGEFVVNEKIKKSDLLYPLLIESSNDAAEAIAEFPGRELFINSMNKKAAELGLASTSFEDPSGLSENNKSTSFDLFKLAEYLKKEKPEILKITTNRSYNNTKHIWFSNNQFLREDGYEGGKSGYIDEALQTVISIFSMPLGEADLHPIAITLLRSHDRYNDVEKILKYLKNNIYYGEEENANIAWIKQGTTMPAVKELNSVTLSFLGDIMLDRGVKSSVMRNFSGDYSALFENIKSLQKSDIVFANLDGPASDKGVDGGSLYSFRMDPSVVPALRGGGISVLSVANNHMADFGREAFTDTLARLKENEILYIGGGINASEAEKPTIVEKQGIKIGYLGFSDKGPRGMTAEGDKAGVLLADNPRFEEIIRNAAESVDYLVVSFHFGEEYEEKHDARQEYLAHRAVDNGAKIVVGHNAHVIQDTEIYRNGYIAYSLGNFIFDQLFSEKTMEGMNLQIKLNEKGEMTVRKDTVKLNNVFQPDKVITGKEEKLIWEVPEKVEI